MAVSLSEITSIRGDANVAAGTAGTGANLAQLPPDQLGLQLLDSLANARLMQNKYELDLAQQRQREFLQNFNSLQVEGVMERDFPDLVAKWVRLAGQIADNMDVIQNPAKDLQRWGELKQEQSQLLGQIAESKQQLALRNSYSNFISTHRDFQTPENLARIQQFSEMPLAERQLDTITGIAPRFDLLQSDIAKEANLIAQQKTKLQDEAKPFQTTTEMTEYLQTEFNNAVRARLRGRDGFNRPMMAAVAEAFRTQSPEVQTQYTNAADGSFRLEDFAVEQLYAPLRMQTDISQLRDPNQFAQIQAQGDQAIRREREQGEQQRRTLAFQKKLADEELNMVASEIPVRQLSIFGAPDQPGAPRQQIGGGSNSTGDRETDRVIDDFAKLFNVTGVRKGERLEGTPVTLDTWMTNAYSIPSGKRSTLDEATGKVIEQDSFLRPQAAWVTTEQDPNARKVIIRYQPEGGQERDLVLPYAEHFQILNNVAGQNNAVRLGGAKVKLLRDLTGRVSPNFEELSAVEIFRNPNRAAPAAGGAPGVITTSPAPANPTTGSFLNATEYKKRKAQQAQNR